jgi:hypothetical protein
MYILIRDVTVTVALLVLPLQFVITSTAVVVVRLRSIAPSCSSTPTCTLSTQERIIRIGQEQKKLLMFSC